MMVRGASTASHSYRSAFFVFDMSVSLRWFSACSDCTPAFQDADHLVERQSRLNLQLRVLVDRPLDVFRLPDLATGAFEGGRRISTAA